MENQNNKEMVNRSGKVWAGLFIIAIGSLLLLRNFGLYLPHWVFSWSNMFIIIGLFIGLRNNFRNNAWFVMVLIGSYFTLQDIFRGQEISDIVFPLALVALGVFLIFKPKSKADSCKKWKRKKDRWRNGFEQAQYYGEASTDDSKDAKQDFDKKNFNSTDYIESVNVFGGSNQVIYSKDLKGGEVTAVFGGGDINLTQADFDGQIIVDVTVIFGGLKIIVPPTWQIKSEVTAIFGGVDDKRTLYQATEPANKLIIVKGVVLFGGVEFKSY
jgi:predicted membrane protein